MSTRSFRVLLAVAALSLAPAAEATPRHRLVWDSLTAVRLNPLGLQEYANLAYRRRLFDSESVLLQDTYVQIGPTMSLSPAFFKPGVHVKVKPAAILELTGAYRYTSFFGTFDQALGWKDPGAVWSDAAMEARGDEAIATSGTQLQLTGRLQGAAGPVAVRNTTSFTYNDLRLPVGDTVFYDQTPDMLVPDEGWMLQNDLDGIWLAGKLKAGVRWTHVLPWYGNGLGDEGNALHRVGPLVAYTLREEPGAVVANPTILVLSQWHVVHRFRAGQEVSAAIPYLAVALTFEGDLIPWRE